MENIVSFRKARNYFSNTWSGERKEVLKKLMGIRDTIQEQARIHSIANITYSSTGIVGGGLAIAGVITAPFTFGVSLGLTIAGLATSVASGVAGAAHGAIKVSIVNNQIKEAQTSLKEHQKSCKEMKRLIRELQQEIKKYNPELERVMKNGQPLFEITFLALKDAGSALSKVATAGLSVMAALGILVDLGLLIGNSVELSSINSGELCKEAQRLQDVIDDMEKEYDKLAEKFS